MIEAEIIRVEKHSGGVREYCQVDGWPIAKNRHSIDFDSGIVFIQIPGGHVSLVDIADFHLVAHYRWSKHYKGYVQANVYCPQKKKSTIVRMHRLILSTKSFCDHINHNKMDNRRCNLRPCNNGQNMAHLSGLKSHNTTGFLGVWKDKARNKFCAQVGKKCLGRFNTAIEAAKIRDAYAVEMYGEFAQTNAAIGLLGVSNND